MDADRADTAAAAVLAVPEIRDYHAINAEIVRLLDSGRRTIRLAGVTGQRLLAAGLAGNWSASIEVDGDAGPELAAGLDAPGLTVIGRGGAADGAASRMRAGRVLVLGAVGPAFGYAQAGGLAVAVGDAAGRAGLRQKGGDLILIGASGPMAGECQSGGRLFVLDDRNGRHAGRGRRGGVFVRIAPDGSVRSEPADARAGVDVVAGLLESIRPWLGQVSQPLFAGQPIGAGPIP